LILLPPLINNIMALPDLTEMHVADTYKGVLHTGNEVLTSNILKTVYDGVGNPSSLKVSKTFASISDITYPAYDPGYNLSLMVSNGTKTLMLSSWNQIQQFVGIIADGTYNNPVITVSNGVITDIVSNSTSENVIVSPERGMRTYSEVGIYTFTVPDGVSYIKFIVTGGGSTGGDTNGSAGATAIGLLKVSAGQIFTLTVGAGGGAIDGASGQASIINYNTVDIVRANGGVTYPTAVADLTDSATAIINNILGNIQQGTLLIKGGVGGIDTDDDGKEESVGAAGYWGSAPAYGGGGGAHWRKRQGANGQSGVIVLEW